MRALLTMTGSDLRQRIRDRSVIIFAVLVPLALMFVLDLVVGDATDSELEPMTVAASAPADDELAAALVEVLPQIEGLDITVEQVDADRARSMAEDGSATIGLLVPEGFGAGLQSGDGMDVTIIEGDSAGLEGQILTSIVTGTVDRFGAAAVATRAGVAADVPPADLAAIGESVAAAEPSITLTEGQASTEQLDGSGTLVAGQAGLFLMFTVGFGVLSLLYEREHGTLARLKSMPMKPELIIAAKAAVSFVLGVVATSILLVAGSLLFGVSFGSPVAVGALVLAVVLASTSLMMVVARVAKTSEQANIAQSVLAMVLGIAGGAFFPIAASGLVGSLLDLNPIAAFIRGLGITAGGGGLTDIGIPLAIMLGFAVVVTVLSRLVPEKGTAL